VYGACRASEMVDLGGSDVCRERIDDIMSILVSIAKSSYINPEFVSYLINSKFGFASRWSKLEAGPVQKLSSTTTSCPSSSKLWTRRAPKNPLPYRVCQSQAMILLDLDLQVWATHSSHQRLRSAHDVQVRFLRGQSQLSNP
jgi:hypothetical protein